MSYEGVSGLEFWSEDRRFGLQIAEVEVRIMLQFCSRAGRHETGGVLIGRYTDELDCAIITAATGPNSDSRAGTTWLERGTRELKALLARSWKEGRGYYVGEWHFHPASGVQPSHIDLSTMQGIARNPAYSCPQPVLLIIGGHPPSAWSASAHVYPVDSDRRQIPLAASSNWG